MFDGQSRILVSVQKQHLLAHACVFDQLRSSTETILSHVGLHVKTVMLGPTTPVIPDAFDHLPIHMLAGSFISNAELALRMIRHGGGGARTLKQVSRKVYCLTQAV